ncbi:MAG: FtsX-like permease family protein [Chloroflexota bacterium]|nr:FtsX-like permease family protein [Chloroflexota bacterium]
MLPFTIAARFLRSAKSQTVLIIIGIAIAISVQIFVGSLLASLQKGLVEKTAGNLPHITISAAIDGNAITGWRDIVDSVEDDDSIEIVSVSADSNAFMGIGDNNKPILLRGFVFDDADRIYGIGESIYEGDINQERGDVLVGKELAEELDIKLGDYLALTAPGDIVGQVRVSGFFDLGVANLNELWVITDLETSQELFGFGDAVTSIELDLYEIFEADAIALDIEDMLGNPSSIKVENWKGQNDDLVSGLDGQRMSSVIIRVAILASVVIAIASILVISVLQKSKQLGILKAMGIKDRDASLIFVYQGFILGLAGSVMGILLGVFLFYVFVSATDNGDSSPLIAFRLENGFLIQSFIINVIASGMAGLIAARRSSGLNPIDVIREG